MEHSEALSCRRGSEMKAHNSKGKLLLLRGLRDMLGERKRKKKSFFFFLLHIKKTARKLKKTKTKTKRKKKKNRERCLSDNNKFKQEVHDLPSAAASDQDRRLTAGWPGGRSPTSIRVDARNSTVRSECKRQG